MLFIGIGLAIMGVSFLLATYFSTKKTYIEHSVVLFDLNNSINTRRFVMMQNGPKERVQIDPNDANFIPVDKRFNKPQVHAYFSQDTNYEIHDINDKETNTLFRGYLFQP